LALEADVLGPFHHAREVAARLDVLADTEVARFALEEWVLPLSTYTQDKHTVMKEAHLVLSLLARATRLAGWEWRRSGSLARFWRLSLRRTVSHCSISRESAHSTKASVAAQANSSPASPQSAMVGYRSLLQHARRNAYKRSRGVQLGHLQYVRELTIL
jgi:hypothetical protein